MLAVMVDAVEPVDQRYELYVLLTPNVAELPEQKPELPVMVGVGALFTVIVVALERFVQPSASVSLTRYCPVATGV